MLRPYQATAYAWDEPSKFHKLVLEVQNSDFRRELSLDIIKCYRPVEIRLEQVKACSFL